MIKAMPQYTQYAYRMPLAKVNPATYATTFPNGIVSGTWLTIDANGYAVPATGTATKAYMGVNDHNATRNTVSYFDQEALTVLAGAYVVDTDQYETGVTYVPMAPLKVSANGKLTLWVSGTDTDVTQIVGYCHRVPASATDTMTFASVA